MCSNLSKIMYCTPYNVHVSNSRNLFHSNDDRSSSVTYKNQALYFYNRIALLTLENRNIEVQSSFSVCFALYFYQIQKYSAKCFNFALYFYIWQKYGAVDLKSNLKKFRLHTSTRVGRSIAHIPISHRSISHRNISHRTKSHSHRRRRNIGLQPIHRLIPKSLLSKRKNFPNLHSIGFAFFSLLDIISINPGNSFHFFPEL